MRESVAKPQAAREASGSAVEMETKHRILDATSLGRRRGFTLYEMVITLTILGTLAAIVVPSMAPADTERLEAVARIVASDLGYARNLAIQYNTNWSLQFDLTNNSYDLVFSGTGTQPYFPQNSRAYGDGPTTLYRVNVASLGASTAGSNGVKLAGAALKTSQQNVTNIVFGPLGGTGPSRSEDTVVWLTTGAGSSTKYVRLTISWITGQVWVDRPDMFTTSSQVLQ